MSEFKPVETGSLAVEAILLKGVMDLDKVVFLARWETCLEKERVIQRLMRPQDGVTLSYRCSEIACK